MMVEAERTTNLQKHMVCQLPKKHIYLGGKRLFIMQQNNDPKHIATTTKNFIQWEKIESFEPARSITRS